MRFLFLNTIKNYFIFFKLSISFSEDRELPKSFKKAMLLFTIINIALSFQIKKNISYNIIPFDRFVNLLKHFVLKIEINLQITILKEALIFVKKQKTCFHIQ